MQSSTDEYIALIGHGGSKWSNGPDNWTLSMTLAAYSKNGGPVITDPVRAYNVVPYQMITLQERLPAYSIFRFRTPSRPGTSDGIPVGMLLGFNLTDERFSALQEELRRPIVYNSARLGMLTYDRDNMWFAGVITWGDAVITLRMESPADIGEAQAPEATVVQLLDDQAYWDRAVRMYAAAELLETKNEDWTNSPDEYETIESFCDKMEITSLSILPNDAFIFWFNDGNMFYEHFIHVDGTLADGPDRAGIVG